MAGSRRWLRRAWPVLRVVIGLGLVALAVWVLSSKTTELSGFTTIFKSFDWWWLLPAIVVEIGSYFCFAAMQYELLAAGHLRAPWSPLVKLSIASQSITNSLPFGNAVASVYGFRWFRRFGADNTLAVWGLAGTLVAATISLSLVAIVGLGIAADQGSSFDLVPVLIGTFLVLLGIGSLFVYERPLHAVVSGALRVSVRLTGRPRGDTQEQIGRIMAWMTAVRLSWSQIGRIITWGTVNWLLDCACFAMMFVAIGAPIPWTGLLLAYGAGQLAATLPITPGGLGVVEGSITVALVAFGGAESTTVDAVLLYRLVSFWFILVLGWALIGDLAWQVRRGRWAREVMSEAPVAGPEAYRAGGAGAVALEGVPAVVDGAGAVGADGVGELAGVGDVGDVGEFEGRGGVGDGMKQRLCVLVSGAVVGALVMAGCSSARSDVGTTDESCYQALPTAAKAVGPHAHLAGVRKYTLGSLKPLAPRLYDRLAGDVPKGQNVCLAGYRGTFTSSTVSKPLGRPAGTLAVAVVTSPGNELLGTLILTKIPVRFQHSHMF